MTEQKDESAVDSFKLVAAGIAHDVNNVLSVILNTAETGFADASNEGVKTALAVIRDAVKRGSAMTKELMAYAGMEKLQLMRAKPALVVEDVQVLSERIVSSNITLDYKLDEQAPDVDVDVSQFWKVLFNIVKNAGEALGDRPGHITLSTTAFEMTDYLAKGFHSAKPLEPGMGALFSIADDGPGIHADLLPSLFDPYVSSKAHGRGLGLANVRRIVEAHGGGVKVTSEVGKGTAFHIWLPASRQASDSTAPSAKPVAQGEVPAAVLVVDNDEAILKTTSILLRALKVVPHVAHNCSESLEILRAQGDAVGAILLDANLDGEDSVELLGALRAAAPKTPVIVSSGSNEEALRQMFAAHPFDAYLGKPYTIAELKDILIKTPRK